MKLLKKSIKIMNLTPVSKSNLKIKEVNDLPQLDNLQLKSQNDGAEYLESENKLKFDLQKKTVFL
jgi:hypothetical protein